MKAKQQIYSYIIMNKITNFLLIIFLISTWKYSEAQNLVLHLPMAGNATDISRFSNNGSISGGVTPTEDRFGNPCSALRFDGINGYITIPHSTSLGNIKDEFSLSTWIKLESSNNSDNLRWLTLLCKGEFAKEEPNMPQYRVQIFQGNTQSTVSINTEFTENDFNFKNHDLEFNQWYNIIVTYDKKNVNFYINSQMVWTYPYNEKLTKNSNNINIGRDIPGAIEYFKGSMSDLRLYDGPLQQKQIIDIYKNSESYAKSYTSEHACPADKILQTDPSTCKATAIVDFPTNISNCGQSFITQIKGPINGSKIGLGTEQVEFRITDNNGSNKTCSYNIQVIDKEAPTILPTSDITLYIPDNEQSIIYNYTLPKATDNCALKSLKLSKGIISNEKFPIGKNLLEFEAIDSSGNKSYSKYTVIILHESDKYSPPNLDTQLLPAEPTFDEKLEMISKEVGSKIEIEGLYFATDRAYINRNSTQQLDKVVKYLNKYSNISIEISGHTNGIPSEKYCDELSTARAKTCYEYLIDKGISKSRLQYIGHGKNQLKFKNDPKNPLNQRVEIIITEVK
jgi:outer membrane protein OmpA-like peptidoglycan-associated protein